MLKGQVVAGDFSKIVMRVKSKEQVELGELVVIEESQEKFILQIYDLLYGSQISQQNLEMVAGMNLEEGSFQLMDGQLRNYQLALLKPMLTIPRNNQSKTSKKLPSFFGKVREITKEDLSFITIPLNPLFIGKLRSGSKEMDFLCCALLLCSVEYRSIKNCKNYNTVVGWHHATRWRCGARNT